MSMYLGQLEILSPGVNHSTVTDGRGAILSWVTQEDIKEFTMLYFYPHQTRGNHYHPEFIEYFLVTEGSILLTTQDLETGKQLSMVGGRGFCFRTPLGVPHATNALEFSTCLSLLTKPWDSCERPIVHQPLVEPK